MKVLFCGLKYEYGKPGAGLSFEYQNFYEVLKGMDGVEASGFFIDEEIFRLGRDAANNLLLKTVEDSKPDLLFCFLFTEEIKKETIEFITKQTQTKTFNWFADDHWRLPIFSRFWAPLFTKVSTTDSQAPAKYKSYGINNVIKTQWGVNTKLFHPQEKKEAGLDLTFVGLNYSVREKYINFLKNEGLPVAAFGSGWETGRIPKERTSIIWGSSKINLNFSESYAYGPKFWLKSAGRLFVKKELGRYKLDVMNIGGNLKSALMMRHPQIKSRVFEIPACGGFLLTGDADNLGDYYQNGKEVVIFKDRFDLADKCRYYLKHEDERQAIAQAGYQRTVKDHTYEQRFREIFKTLF
jgi:spore maturation protein CgeB